MLYALITRDENEWTSFPSEAFCWTEHHGSDSESIKSVADFFIPNFVGTKGYFFWRPVTLRPFYTIVLFPTIALDKIHYEKWRSFYTV